MSEDPQLRSARKLRSMSTDEVVEWWTTVSQNSFTTTLVQLELQRRVAVAQVEAASAAGRTTRYVLWSALIALVVGVGGWLVAVFSPAS